MTESVSDSTASGWKRYIAIDLHKHYLMVGGIDGSQRVVLPPANWIWSAGARGRRPTSLQQMLS
jgi:hypothetical protein